jgi:hypothetical protein
MWLGSLTRAPTTLGSRPEPDFLSMIVGTWLDNDANR